jgi:aspartate-semialdehyde dehydrogenase
LASRRIGTVERLRAGVVGATGFVGQRLVERLASHPWFTLVAVGASERSAGRRYEEVCRWSLGSELPAAARGLEVLASRPEEFGECDFVFSALEPDSARQIEPAFVRAGFPVVSNSSAHRMDPDVPLLVPEVNASHLELLRARPRRTGAGFLVTNPNCSATGLVLALAPLHRRFGVKRVVVTTLQAVSGAGLEGPRGLEILDNVVPFIPREEEKIEMETGKILGRIRDGQLDPAPIVVSAHCHRVPTLEGHLEAVSVELDSPATVEEATEALLGFRGEIEGFDLPSAPSVPILVRKEPDRPQTRLDREAGGGMSIVVGRIRRCPVLTLRFELLAHNTVRGAAGGAILNAELLVHEGLLGRRRNG